jgi:hypothetical protein
MKIDKKETTMLVLLGVGLLVLKNNNWDANMDGTKDQSDKGLILFLGALAFAFLA